jgi:hypothetical protein
VYTFFRTRKASTISATGASKRVTTSRFPILSKSTSQVLLGYQSRSNVKVFAINPKDKHVSKYWAGMDMIIIDRVRFFGALCVCIADLFLLLRDKTGERLETASSDALPSSIFPR